MTLRNTMIALAILSSGALATACAASDSSSAEEPEGGAGGGTTQGACVPGQQVTCGCPGGAEGIQVCKPDGSGLDACDCSIGTSQGGSGAGSGDPCGDNVCGDDEDCHTCAKDCGVCEPCDIAPSCDNAHIPPPNMPHAVEFDIGKMTLVSPAELQQRLVDAVAKAGPEMRVLAAALDDTVRADEHPLVGYLREVLSEHPRAADALRRQLGAAGMGSPAAFRARFPEKKRVASPPMTMMDVEYPGGTMECGAPLLRVGISKIKVHEEDDDYANDIVYCVVQAEAKTGAEIRITPKTPNLDEGDEHQFALDAGVFWGQKEPTTPGGNLLVTYDCIEADTSDGYQKLVESIGNAADKVGDVVEGDNGWIFKTAGAIAPVVSTGLSLDGDDQLFNAQQTIPLDKQLELTNGRWWTVRRAGTHNLSDWDWELFIGAWGCAQYGTL